MNRAPDDPAGHLAWARCNLCGYEPQRCLTVSAAKLSPPWPIHGGHLGMVTWGWGSQEKKKRESIIRHLNMLVGLKGTSGEREIEYIVEGAVNCWSLGGKGLRSSCAHSQATAQAHYVCGLHTWVGDPHDRRHHCDGRLLPVGSLLQKAKQLITKCLRPCSTESSSTSWGMKGLPS